MMQMNLFNEFAILLMLAVVLGYVAQKLKQPLVLAFILVGAIAGPQFLNWISSAGVIEVLASIGVTLLLFIVGLRLDIHTIKTFGVVTLFLGLWQMLITIAGGFAIALLLQMPTISALFIAIMLAFSSTIIIIKILSDRDEIYSLYGRISVGILIIQDLVAVIAIIVLSSIRPNETDNLPLHWELVTLMLNAVGLLAVIGLITRYVFPRLLIEIAESRELLVLFALTWAVVMAMFGESLGFGREVGGFLAGVSLAPTRYREAIASRLETVRNILILFFFLSLGSTLQLSVISDNILPAILLSLFVLFGKPLIVLLLMNSMKFRNHSGFLTGLTMGQISEFSLILAALGLKLGYIDQAMVSMVTFIGLVTIGCSAYLMANANKIYHWLSPWLMKFERNVTFREDIYFSEKEKPIDVIIYGFGRQGEYLAKLLVTKGYTVLGIDFDPRTVQLSHYHHFLIRYGDADDPEFIKTLPLNQAKWIVSTIPFIETNMNLLASLKEENYQGKIAISVQQDHDIATVEKMNVDLVLIPYQNAAQAAAEKLDEQMRGV